MDGMHRLSNLLIIGTTNRKDLLDDALLRPGRFDLQIEIPLPDAKGREDILRIHTRRMAASGRLDASVDLGALARDSTDSFTGAELEGAVKSAASFAVERALRAQVGGEGEDEDEDEDEEGGNWEGEGDVDGEERYTRGAQSHEDAEHSGDFGAGGVSKGDRLLRRVSVTQHDLMKAMGDVEPQHRAPQAQFRTLLGGGLIHYGPPLDGILLTLRAAAARARRGGVVAKQMPLVPGANAKKKTNAPPPAAAAGDGDESSRTRTRTSEGKGKGGGGEEVTYDTNTKWASGAVTVLLHGPAGCGKSAVAAFVAREAHFAFSKVVTADSFLDDRGTSRAEQLTAAFDETRKHAESLLLLDDLDGVVDHVRSSTSMTWNSQSWSQLRLLLRRHQPAGHRLLVLATSSSLTVMEFPQIAEMFNIVVEVYPRTLEP
jgi:SpoVK/Ycf46/Vps4 family AAA+-type ATPase